MFSYRLLFFLFLTGLLLNACTHLGNPSSSSPTAAASSPTPSLPPLVSATPPPTPIAAPSFTSTAEPTLTLTLTPAPTATSTPFPTYIVLRGKVTVDQAVCHYGPGAPYLYKYAVIGGSNLEIISRVEGGNYLEVQAIGGNNPCWVNAKYMQVQGDLTKVKPVPADQVKLPRSPYYAPPASVSATRQGNQVTVMWSPLALRPGDDSEQYPYVLEAWLCQAGQIVFTPIGTYQTALAVDDEPGCTQLSRARLLAAEKHGYTRPLEVAWPPAPTLTP
ncbi:MAG: hypothetical protein HPY59_14110 [Anaerolineae bacterium]|nr:hypothetical protein [Anaerolineae bacterium]